MLPWFRAIKRILEQLQNVRLIEQATFHPEQLYVGRIDCIASYQNVDCLVEWKTVETYVVDRRDEYALQAVAYLDAINQTHKLSIKNVLVVVASRDQEAIPRLIREDRIASYLIEWQRIKQIHQEGRSAETKEDFNQGESSPPVLNVFKEFGIPQAKNLFVEEAFNPSETSNVKLNPDVSDNLNTSDQVEDEKLIFLQKHYTEDSIRLYLQEISQVRLLRADEEIALARKIADLLELERTRFRLMEKLGREPSQVEWAQEVKMKMPQFRYRLHLGRRAKDKMVQANLRLVVSIAKKYMNRGLSFQDLIQEGSLGLIRATEKFDYEKGYKFSTYATWWIRQAILRAIADQSRVIRLPVHLYETILRIKKTVKFLSLELGRQPTEAEIADRMYTTIEKLRLIAKCIPSTISLDISVKKGQRLPILSSTLIAEEDTYLGDLIEADCEPEEQVSKNMLREDLEAILATLSPREKDVLRLRYGLDDGRMKTLEEIGHIFNTTHERICQIEAKALRKLRHPNRNHFLRDFIR